MHFLSKITLLALSIATTARAGMAVGQSFPDPTKNGAEGSLPTLSGKVVLYDFWGSWCGPCVASFPAYDALYQKYKAKGLVIVGIGIDTEKAPAEKFLKKVPHSFPVCFDREQKLVSAVKPPSMPTAYLVGKDGKVLRVHQGFHGDKSVAELETAIQAALN